jgi:glutaminyl-peptide cyclotransferase
MSFWLSEKTMCRFLCLPTPFHNQFDKRKTDSSVSAKSAECFFRLTPQGAIFAFLTASMSLVMTARQFSPQATGAGSTAPVFGYKVIHTYPHDHNAFIQGFIYLNGAFYESTGLNGRSSLRKVKIETGEVLQRIDIPQQYFAEGLTDWRNELIQLTWKAGVGFVYDRPTFRQLRTFRYGGEGWGLTHDGTRIIESDGSSVLRFFDPETLRETGSIAVTDGNQPVDQLNELEYIKGEIWANVWQTDRIVVIDPKTGRVNRWIDLRGLLSNADREDQVDVLNGIAYDATHDRIFVTGKLWPKVFEIRVFKK